jgi:hypothetical protein
VDFLDKKPPEPMQLSVKLVFEATGAVADGRSGAAGGPGCYSAREHKIQSPLIRISLVARSNVQHAQCVLRRLTGRGAGSTCVPLRALLNADRKSNARVPAPRFVRA